MRVDHVNFVIVRYINVYFPFSQIINYAFKIEKFTKKADNGWIPEKHMVLDRLVT